jgi:hypothetical protein
MPAMHIRAQARPHAELLSQSAQRCLVSRNPRIRTPLESRSFSSLRDGVLLPIGRVVGGRFSLSVRHGFYVARASLSTPIN